VLNSVSFKDGTKFNNCKATYDVAARIEGINVELRGLRRDLRLCKGVEENSERVKSNIKQMEDMDKAKKDTQREKTIYRDMER